jgi:two-component system response regulator YesN
MRCLIVDDESATRRYLLAIAPWERLGFDDLVEVENGDAAIQAFRGRPFDLVVTDMRMPSRDGVAFLDRLEQAGAACPIIVVSGFDDFEYTHRAIRSHVIDYILKPVDRTQFLAAVEKALGVLNGGASIAGKTVGVLRREAAGSVAGLAGGACRSVVLRLLNHESVLAKRFDGQAELMAYSLEVVVASARDCEPLMVRHREAPAELIVSIGEVEEVFSTGKRAAIARLVAGLEEKTGVQVLAGVGLRYESPDGFEESCRSARSAILKMNVLENLPIAVAGERQGLRPNASLLQVENALLGALGSGRTELAIGVLERFFSATRATGFLSLENLELLSMEFLVYLDRVLRNHCENLSDLVGSDFIDVRIGSHVRDLNECRRWMFRLVEQTMPHMNSGLREDQIRLFPQIVSFISEHYAERIDLERLSSNFLVSREHISRLFKRELNIGFVEFLTKIRLDQARHLLMTTDQRVAEVAYSVGFSDEAYFSRVFRRVVGIPPQEYRSGG